MLSGLRDFFFGADGKPQRDLIVGAVFLFAGIALTVIGGAVRNWFRRKKEVKENQHIDLSGEWYAAWETSVNGHVVINTERIGIRQRGSTVEMWNHERSPENPEGGYLWRGQLTFSHGESLMGWYYPLKEENITSRGIMYLHYDAQRRVFAGEWVGKSYDGDLCNGYVVISSVRDKSRVGLQQLIERAKTHPVNILGSVPFFILPASPPQSHQAQSPAEPIPAKKPKSD